MSATQFVRRQCATPISAAVAQRAAVGLFEAVPGYAVLGRLFANGYLKALLQGTQGVG